MPKRVRIDPDDAVRAAAAQAELLSSVGRAVGVPAEADPVLACVHLVLRALDVAERDSIHPAALAVAVRHIATVLQQRAPGHSVEVRIPGPSGTAFQCGDGPRHTRGTPPNVVETDPITFVKLGAGRIKWPAAVASGALRASGSRNDLSHLLPAVDD